jgi:hypothetical protein
MGRNIFRQEEQIRKSDLYVDSTAPTEAAFETNPVNLEDDLNNLRSAHKRTLVGTGAGNWWDDLVTPSALDTGSQRGVNELNTGLHAVERKRVLVKAVSLADVVVTAAQNWEVLAAGELPPNTTAAVGAVTTEGTVVAPHGATFDTHSLAEVSGAHAIGPKNMVEVVDGATRDPILSSGRRIYGLLHGESGVTDGATITDTTTTRVQVSFVRVNATGDDLEACPVADIAGKTVNLCFTERKALEDLTEQDFLRGAVTDVPGAAVVDRQTSYDNQGTTPVDVTTNSFLDLEGPGLEWTIRDDLEAALFRVVEGSAGGTSTVQIASDTDTFDVDAVVNNFLNGASFDTGAAATTINVGVTANQIDSGGALKLLSTAADLSLAAGLELNMTDSYRAGSTWSLADGVALANSSQEWSDFETAFGEVSLLDAIVQAKNTTGRRKAHAAVTAAVAANADASGPATDNNLDAELGDLSAGTFNDDYDFFYNGQYQRPGAGNDIVAGTSLALGQVKFQHKLKIGDEVMVIDWIG